MSRRTTRSSRRSGRSAGHRPMLGSRRISRGEQQMSLQSLNRRRFLASSALGAAALAAPSMLRAQGAPIKVGILQPVSGAMSYSGQQGRIGAQFALDEINAAGIKSLGGAKIEPVFGDA